MRLLDQLKRTLSTQILSGGDDELGRDDLLRHVEEGILALRRHGSKGKEVFPAGVRVRIEAADGSLESLKAFVADPAFERDVEARLVNRLINVGDLPARRYEVVRGEANKVTVEDDPTVILGVFVVEGGDKDGDRYVLELGRREWRLGRGRWHQERANDQRLPNDVILTETQPFVSRAAAIVVRAGAQLEVESRQQGEFLIVVRRDGSQLRPAMTATGRVPLRPGDRLEFHDGSTGRISLLLQPV